MNALRYALGWACFQVVMLMPIRLDSRVYCWALAWAGYYAHDPRHTPAGVSVVHNDQQEKIMPYTVIEQVEMDGTQWGVSLNGPNPEAKDFYPCDSKEHAWHLYEALTHGVDLPDGAKNG